MQRISLALFALLAGAATASAQLHQGDIILDSIDGNIIVGGLVDGVVEPGCVFAAQLNALDETLNPGFDSATGVFPTNADLFPAFRSDLRVWDGAAFISAAPNRMAVRWGPLGPVLSPETEPAEPVQTIPVGVSANGEYHIHYKFTLVGDGDAAPDGVYALELEFGITPASLSPSEPFWMVFDHDADPIALEDAITSLTNDCAGTTCVVDLNEDGDATVLDLLLFLTDWFDGSLDADIDMNGVTDVLDLLDFLDGWFVGCPA